MSSTTQNDITNALTSAMSTIADASTSSKEATLVVEAEIVEILDAGIGTYKISYLGNKFEATTAHTEIDYEIGDLVYVIIPNGNFNKNKIILSPATPSTAVYASTKIKNSYITIGGNLFKTVSNVSLCTYKPHDADPSGTDPSPIIDIDTTGFSALFQAALTESRTFNFTCKIQTDIEKARRSKGNYGLILDIPVVQTINGESVSKYYSVVIDVNNITGDPYHLSVPSLQNFYFTLPEDMNYDETTQPRIRSFVVGFIGENNTKPDDIFITDIQVLPTLEVDETTMSGYYGLITASEGASFLASRTGDTKTLSVTAYLNGKVTNINKFDCYWFKENIMIDATNDKFHRLGGIGWEILNKVSKKDIAEDGKINYQYVTNVYSQIVLQNEIHYDTRYKCVLVKDEQVISSSIVIKNLASTAKIKLSTVDGFTNYAAGVGDAQLQIEYYETGITDVDVPDFIIGYAWQRLDKKGTYIDNDFYEVDEFNTRINNTYYTKIHYPVSEIDEANTIACTVYIDTPSNTGESVKRQIIGTVWLTLTIGEVSAGRIVLTNGDKLYKYDADGDSPMVADYDGPLSSALKTIDPISLTIYKEDGSELTADEYKVTTVDWLVPINSMYQLTTEQKQDTESNPGYYTISGLYSVNSSLSYKIKSSYNKNKLDNVIIVKVNAPSAILKQTLSTTANIRFLKDGEAGTNGSKYSALVVYNGFGYGEKDADGKVNKIQLIYIADEDKWYWYNTAKPEVENCREFGSITFSSVLYTDGEKVSDLPDTSWSVFDNAYNWDGDNIICPFIIDNTGTITPSNKSWTDVTKNYCGTVEARVRASRTQTTESQTNSEEYVYAYYPIECTYIEKKEYLGSCMPSIEGGFFKVLYAADGTNPQYDNSENFYVVDNLYNDDIGDLYDYTWSGSENIKTPARVTDFTCRVTPVTKYDNGVAKNFIRVHLGRSQSEQDKIIALKNNYVTNKENETNRLNYYNQLQNNIDIFQNFDYNDYISELNTTTDFYSLKTNLTETINQMLDQLNHLDYLCGVYSQGVGAEDANIRALKIETEEKINTVNELIDLICKLGTDNQIITKIKAITPSSLIINNILPYDNPNFAVNYYSMNSSAEKYNNLVNSVYTNYYNQLDLDKIIEQDTAIQGIVSNLQSFVNSSKLENLTKTYDDCNEEAYKYSALVDVLKSRVNSISSSEINTYTYESMVNEVIKPMYDSINNYMNTSYTSTIDNINNKIEDYGHQIELLDNMLLPINSINIIHIKPIIMIYNRYEMSQLNGWDGNKLTIAEDAGYILAPQIGAGKKNADNNFTGIVMGVKQLAEKSSLNQKIGLFGFSSGVQSLFLNAEDGSALFGKSSAGQITIDPSLNKGLIYSGNFWKNYGSDGKPTNYSKSNENGAGMLIDFTTPEIRFGSGNFEVNSSGHVTAKGGGSIGGWVIGNDSLYSNKPAGNGRLTLESSKNGLTTGVVYSHNHANLTSTGVGFYLGADGLSIGNSIRISSASGGNIYVGRVSGTAYWTISGNGSNSYIGYNASSFDSSNLNTTEPIIGGNTRSVYIGTDGIRLGNKFAVDQQGNLAATSGSFKGKINASDITGGTITGAEITSTGDTSVIIENGKITFNYGSNESTISAYKSTLLGTDMIQFSGGAMVPNLWAQELEVFTHIDFHTGFEAADKLLRIEMTSNDTFTLWKANNTRANLRVDKLDANIINVGGSSLATRSWVDDNYAEKGWYSFSGTCEINGETGTCDGFVSLD